MPIPEEVERRIDGATQTAFLATSSGDRPHVAPVWYRYDGDGVIEVTTVGRKLANCRANPRVSLAIQKASDGVPEWAVVCFGTATVVDDPDATERAARRIDRKYGVEPEPWPDNALVRIEVGSATCRA